MSVFSGGFTLDAARDVCAVPDTEDVLAALVDKSLVELRGDRYRMLETIRTFAADVLQETDQTARWQHEHARHFLDLAEHADARLRTADQLSWLGRLDADYANLRSALHHAAGTDPPLALRLVGALTTYWWLRGLTHEAARCGRAVAQSVGPDPPEGLTEEYVLAVFNAAADITAPEVLRTHLGAVTRLIQGWTRPLARPILPVLWASLVGPSAAEQDTLPGPTTALLGSDPWGRALTPMSDGLQQTRSGDLGAAELSLERALERFRDIGERWGLFQTLGELSRFASWRGDHERALGLLEEAIDLAGELQASDNVAELLSRRSLYRLRAGDLGAAYADGDRALDLAVDTGTLGTIARARATLADVARRDGDTDRAEALIGRALQECPTGWLRPAVARQYVLLAAGRVALAADRPREAADHHGAVLNDRDGVMAAAALDGLADVAATAGEGVRAARLLGAAAVVRGMAMTGDPDVRRVTAAARAATGAETFAAEYAAVHALGRDEALRRARHHWRR